MDFEQTRTLLLATNDKQVGKLVGLLEKVFRAARFRPDAEVLMRERSVIDEAKQVFPAPFAIKFSFWADKLSAELNDAAAAFQNSDADDPRQDELEMMLRLRFRAAALQLEACWKQIVHFLPFILIASLRRLHDDVIRREGAQLLGRVLRSYNAFYVKHELERQLEADQYHLLVALLKLFRVLSERGALGADFLFAPLMTAGRQPFNSVFPERFDAGLLLLHQIRNRLTHGGLADRLPVEALVPVAHLMKWCFLDIVAILTVPCRAFSMNYVVEAKTSAAEPEALTLDFSGVAGLTEARYLFSSEPQLEDYAFFPYRIYMMARAKCVGSGSGEVLAPRDYLDLTPFLIADRLRNRVALPGAVSGASAQRQQVLFALQQHLEPLHQMLFSELGGKGDITRPSDAGDSEADLLLRQIGEFRARYKQLVDQVSSENQVYVSITTLRSRLWRISADHLGALIQADRYDETGVAQAGLAQSQSRPVYDEKLFIEPSEGAAVAAFFASSRRALLLVGDSGAGKSNLLVHHYLAQLRAGRLAVFLTGRRFESASFRDALTGKVVARVCDGWQSLSELAEFLEENDETLTIFIDAVNEYSGPAGPRALLESMIAEIGGEQLRRARLVASCRGETWKQYKQYLGVERPLDPALFHTPDGDAVRVGRFETPELCSRLYAAYRDYYNLQPQSFDELTPAVRALIAQPFMMAIIGETYSNRVHRGEASSDAIWHVVPPDLDYFSLFEQLTQRKAGDAQILVPASDVAYRAVMPEWIEEFCELLAGMIFERLTTPDPRVTSGRDALPIDSVSKRAELEHFVQNRHAVSVLEATLQVGLLELTRIQQLDRQGRERAGAAYVFFHDQYTQYCLAAVYQTKILGLLDAQTLADPALLDTMLDKIDAVIAQSVKAPILAGALDHWLQKNIKIFHGGRIEPVIALLDRLAGHGSPALRHQAVAFVSHLILRGSFSPQGILGPIFSTGTPALKLALVNAFVDFWPALQPAALQTFIDCCDSRDDGELIDRLGDIFVLHLALDPPLAADYLCKAIRPLSLTSLAGPMRSFRQSRFGLQFTIFAVMTCFDQPAALQAARDFFRAKYRPLLSLLAESRRDNAWTRVTRKALNGIFDNFGVSQWNKFIVAAQQSANDRFFVETEGVVQQELLARFLPYVIDLHNGEFDRLSLAGDTPFRDLVLRMLQFRVMSIVGYNALICLPAILLRQDWVVTRSLVMALVESRTPPGLFFGQLLLVNLAYSDPETALPALELLRDEVIAQLLEEEVENDWSISFCIATLDVELLWPAFEGVLRHFFNHFDRRADPAACAAFGDHLYKVCYCQDRMLGQRLIALMLGDSQRFLGPLWRACTMKVLAAMLTRSPATLYAALEAQGIDESLAREARTYQSAEIIKQSRLFPFQLSVNRFIAWLFVAEPRLRRAVVKYVIGSLARGGSAEDFPPGIRQMAATLISVFFGDDPEAVAEGRIDIEEIDAAIAQARRFW